MSGTLEERVTAIEERLRMGSGLRAAGDRDPGDLAQTVRAQHHLVQALSITQSQHGELLRKQGEAIEQLKPDHGAKLDQIIGLLGQLLDQDETKPG